MYLGDSQNAISNHLHYSYSSFSHINDGAMVVHVARLGEKRNSYVLVGRGEGKKPLGRPMRRWEHNITKDLKVAGQEGVDWIQLAQNRDQGRAPVNTEHSAAWC
jgi:hypothetical protein